MAKTKQHPKTLIKTYNDLVQVNSHGVKYIWYDNIKLHPSFVKPYVKKYKINTNCAVECIACQIAHIEKYKESGFVKQGKVPWQIDCNFIPASYELDTAQKAFFPPEDHPKIMALKDPVLWAEYYLGWVARDHQRIHLRCTSKKKLDRWGRRCLESTTLVATPNGPVPIAELKPGDWVYDENAQPIVVLSIFDQGIQKVTQLNNNGRKLVACTQEHKWLVHRNDNQDLFVVEKIDGHGKICTTSLNGVFSSIEFTTGEIYHAHTYDIEVNSKNHLFLLSNGLVTSNSGKTEACAVEILYYALTTEIQLGTDYSGKRILTGPTTMVLAPYLNQIQNVFEKLDGLLQRNPDLMKMRTKFVKTPHYRMEFKGGVNLKGAKIIGFTTGGANSGDATTIRGQGADKIYLDETDYMHENDYNAILPILHEGEDRSIIASSTPCGSREQFYKWAQESPDWKEFHFPSTVLDHWDKVEESAKAESSETGFYQEYMACHAEGTLVNGQPIETISIGDRVKCDTGYCTVRAKGCTGQNSVYKTILETGEELVTTPDHKFKVNNEQVEITKTNFVDKVFQPTQATSVDELWASLVAFSLGDGTIVQRTRTSKFGVVEYYESYFYSKYEAELERLAIDINYFLNTNISPKFKKGAKSQFDSYQLRLPTSLSTSLIDKGAVVGKKVEQVFSIPNWVKSHTDPGVIRAFISTLFGNEGSTPRKNTKGKSGHSISLSMYKKDSTVHELLIDVSNILSSMDIKHSLVHKDCGTTIYLSARLAKIKFFQQISYRYSNKEFKAWLWLNYLMCLSYTLHRNQYYSFDEWVGAYVINNIIMLPVLDQFPIKSLTTWNITVDSPDHSYLLDNTINNYNSFVAQETGVYQPQYIAASRSLPVYSYEDYEYNPEHIIAIGVDWNSNAGTEIAVVAMDKRRHYWLVEVINVPKQGWTQLAAVEEVISINNKWRPKFIYVDSGHGSCVAPGTILQTPVGTKKIIDIQKDDHVLTADGTFERVINLVNTPAKQTYEVIPSKCLPIEVSYCHPFLVYHSTSRFLDSPSDQDLQWVQTQDLNQEYDFIAIAKRPLPDYKEIKILDLVDVFENDSSVEYDDKFIWNKNSFSSKEAVIAFYAELTGTSRPTILRARRKLRLDTKACLSPAQQKAKDILDVEVGPSWLDDLYIKHPRFIDIADSDFLLLLGWYLSEGSAGLATSQIEISQHVENHDLSMLRDIAVKTFPNAAVTLSRKRNNNLIQRLNISGYIPTRLFVYLCGKLCDGKFLHPLLDDVNPTSLLRGLIDGDGCVKRMGNSAQICISLTSRNLIFQIRQIFIDHNILPNTYYLPPRTKRHKEQYRIDLGGDQHTIKHIEDLVGINLNDIDRVNRKSYLLTDSYILVPIRSIVSLGVKDNLVDIEIENSHSFMGNGVCLHNTNIELLQSWSLQQRTTKPGDPGGNIYDILKPFAFGSKLEIADPTSGQMIKKPAKDFMVQNSVRLFEERTVHIPIDEEVLGKQLINYIIEKVRPDGQRIYGQNNPRVGDHRLDAFNLALVAYKLEMSDFAVNANIVTTVKYGGIPGAGYKSAELKKAIPFGMDVRYPEGYMEYNLDSPLNERNRPGNRDLSRTSGNDQALTPGVKLSEFKPGFMSDTEHLHVRKKSQISKINRGGAGGPTRRNI